MDLIKALNAVGARPFRNESNYPDSDAQRNLAGRTHYADADTLKYFISRILRGQRSKNGLYYILQESLPHPDFDMKRIRRNVVFNVFGSVQNNYREVCHKNAVQADKHYNDALAWCDSEEGEQATLNYLQGHLSRMAHEVFDANQALNESEDK